MKIQYQGKGSTSNLHYAKGFTLMDLTIRVALFATLATVVVPLFEDFMQENQISSDVNQIVAAIDYRRSE